MKLVITERAKRDLSKLDKKVAKRIVKALEEFVHGQQVDILKLKGTNEFRVRVGDYRVRIEISKEAVTVFALRVLHRREAYR